MCPARWLSRIFRKFTKNYRDSKIYRNLGEPTKENIFTDYRDFDFDLDLDRDFDLLTDRRFGLPLALRRGGGDADLLRDIRGERVRERARSRPRYSRSPRSRSRPRSRGGGPLRGLRERERLRE